MEGRKKAGLELDPIYRTFLISPPFAQGFTQLFSAIRYNSTIPDDLRDVAARPGYLGTDGEGGLSLRLLIVMQYVDAMTKEIQVGDDIFDVLRQEICDER